MPDADRAAKNRESGPALAASRRLLPFVLKNWDLLGVLLLVLATLPPFLITARSLVVVTEPNLLDDSWVLDMSFKASRGIWLGRDVGFTYGPLFQWLSSAPSRIAGPAMGAIYTTWNLLPLWLSYLLLWGAIRLLLPEQPAWKRLLLLLLLSVFWFLQDLRVAVSVFLFTLFSDQWHSLTGPKIRLCIVGSLAAALCAISFLLSADTGVYAVAAFVLALLGVVAGDRAKRPHLGQVAVVMAAFVVASAAFVLVINSLLAQSTGFGFWKTSFAIVSGYRWMEASQMAKPGKAAILAALMVGAIVFLARRFSDGLSTAQVTKRAGFLLGAFAFAVLRLQSGLVRSDMGHVMIAIFPMTLFVGALLFAVRSRVGSLIAAALAVTVSWTIGQPDPELMPGNIVGRYRQAVQPPSECLSGTKEFSRVCFPSEFVNTLQAGVDFLEQHSTPQQSVVVFPFQNIFGVAAARNVAGGLLQSYLASGTYLPQVDVSGLERQSAPAGLYFPDGPLSDPVDGISNFTRSPQVWFWLQRHYQSDVQVAPGITGLVRDDSRTLKIAQESQQLGLAPHTYPINRRSTQIDLGNIAWPSPRADFLWLKINVQYPMALKVRKPQRLQLEISRSDGSVELRSFLAVPNISSEVWIYPWDESQLSRYFEADATRWSADAPPLTHLRLWVTPLDWISQVPMSITIEDARAFRLTMHR